MIPLRGIEYSLGVVFLALFIIMLSQGSSFNLRLILVPFTLVLIVSIRWAREELILLLIIIVFVGGVLILMVGITSLVSSEQRFVQRIFLPSVLVRASSWIVYEGSSVLVRASSWIVYEGSSVLAIGLFLIIRLYVISRIFYKNKFLTRRE